MKFSRTAKSISTLLFLVFFSAISTSIVDAEPSVDPDDIYWSDQFAPNGLNRSAQALIEYRGEVVAAGAFTYAGKTMASRIASWDGQEWHALGGGTNNSVVALAVYENMLIAGGSFDSAGDKPAFKIAAWNGDNWSPMGAGFDGGAFGVACLTLFDGKLIAGGWFTQSGTDTVMHLAQWNGTSWQPVGGGTNGGVTSLTVWNDKLVVGGAFTRVGNVTASGLAVWDGAEWSSVPLELHSSITDLIEFQGSLFAAGFFEINDTIRALGRWDGTSWHSIIDAPIYGIKAMTVSNDTLVLGGSFNWAGEQSATGLALFDGSSWRVPDTSIEEGSIIALTVSDNKIYAGGVSSASGKLMHGIAMLDESGWVGVGPHNALGVPARTFELYHDQLIAGGYLACSGGTVLWGIGAWDGNSWSQFGQSPYFNGLSGVVTDILIHQDKVIAVGSIYNDSSGVPYLRHIAQSDDGPWMPFGDVTLNGYLNSILLYHDQIVIGGSFKALQPDTARNVAIWNGSSWTQLGTGEAGTIIDMTIYHDTLIAAGSFNWNGGTEHAYLAAWDGTNWNPYAGTLCDGPVLGLEVYDELLLMSGDFLEVNGNQIPRFAAWNGNQWFALGGGISDSETVVAFQSYDGRLVVGGHFTSIGGNAANNIAAWDGSQWSPLGSGLSSTVTALSVYQNNLMVSGEFGLAGGKPSLYIAMWTKGNITDVEDDPALPLIPSSIELSQNYPNPFNPSTEIQYDLPATGPVRLEVFNMLGQVVATLVDDIQSAGHHLITWYGLNDQGESVASGLYLYRLTSSGRSSSRKMLLLR